MAHSGPKGQFSDLQKPFLQLPTPPTLTDCSCPLPHWQIQERDWFKATQSQGHRLKCAEGKIIIIISFMLHRSYLVLEGEFRRDPSLCGTPTSTVTAAVGCVAVIFHVRFWQLVSQSQDKNEACQAFLLLLWAPDLQSHGLIFTQGRGVCANSDTLSSHIQVYMPWTQASRSVRGSPCRWRDSTDLSQGNRNGTVHGQLFVGVLKCSSWDFYVEIPIFKCWQLSPFF